MIPVEKKGEERKSSVNDKDIEVDKRNKRRAHRSVTRERAKETPVILYEENDDEIKDRELRAQHKRDKEEQDLLGRLK